MKDSRSDDGYVRTCISRCVGFVSYVYLHDESHSLVCLIWFMSMPFCINRIVLL